MVQPLNVVLNLLVARQQGITDQQAQLRTALIGGMLPLTTGLVLTTVLARREAEANASPSSTQIPNGIPPIMPSLIGLKLADAQSKLDNFRKDAKLEDLEVNAYAVVGNQNLGVVVMQNPDPGSSFASDTTVTLLVGADAKFFTPSKEYTSVGEIVSAEKPISEVS